MRVRASPEAFKMPPHRFPLSPFPPPLSSCIWPHSTRLDTQWRGDPLVRQHALARARKHTHIIFCPLAGARTVSAAILSGHEMTSIRPRQHGCAIAGDPHTCRYTNTTVHKAQIIAAPADSGGHYWILILWSGHRHIWEASWRHFRPGPVTGLRTFKGP